MSGGAGMPAVPAALSDPVLRRYPLRRQRIPVGGQSLSVVLPDALAWRRSGQWVDRVMHGLEPPYWVRVWPAAVALARLLVRARDLHDSRVLDLGCGIGIPGITAAGLGATVSFVDREPDALAFARWNAERQPGHRFSVTVQQLDWSRQEVSGCFDLILLSDVTYHESHHEPLLRQLSMVMAADGCVIHSDPERQLSTQFLRRLEAEWHVCQTVVRSHYRGLSGTGPGSRMPVRLSVVTRSTAASAAWRQRLRWASDVEPEGGCE